MKTEIKWGGMILLGVMFLILPAVHAADVQPEPDPPESAASEEMKSNLQADLATIAADREAVIDDIVAMWPIEPGGEEDLRLALSLADDEELLAISNAGNFDEVIATLGGADLLEVRTDRDYVFTPVTRVESPTPGWRVLASLLPVRDVYGGYTVTVLKW